MAYRQYKADGIGMCAPNEICFSCSYDSYIKVAVTRNHRFYNAHTECYNCRNPDGFKRASGSLRHVFEKVADEMRRRGEVECSSEILKYVLDYLVEE